jgi:hypothetical protein
MARINTVGIPRSGVSRNGTDRLRPVAVGRGDRRRRPTDHMRSVRWTNAGIVEALGQRQRAGKPLHLRALRREHGALLAAAVHRFGAYQAAIEAAGLNYEKVRRQPRRRWDKSNIIAELRRLRHRGERLNLRAVEQSFPALAIAAQRAFGSYRAAIGAAGLEYGKVAVFERGSWPASRVLRELREFKQQGTGLWVRAIRRRRPYLLPQAVRHFGSYANAARIAGLKADDIRALRFRRWSVENIGAELRGLYKRDPGLLATARMMRCNSGLWNAARHRFGSYRAALEAAGLDYRQVVRQMAPPMGCQDVIERLNRLHQRGADLRYSALERAEPRLLNAAQKRFGRYRKALEAAGVPVPPRAPLKYWSWPRVLQRIAELHARGVDLRFETAQKELQPLFFAGRYYYETWRNALHHAGVDYWRVVRGSRRQG